MPGAFRVDHLPKRGINAPDFLGRGGEPSWMPRTLMSGLRLTRLTPKKSVRTGPWVCCPRGRRAGNLHRR